MIIFSPTDWTRSPSNWSNLMGSWLNTLQAVIVFFFNPSKEACVNDTFFFVSHFSRLQLRARALSFVLSPERLAWQAWEKEHAALGLFYLLHDSAISNLISFGLWNDLGFTDYIKQRSYLLYQYGLVAGNLVSTVEFGRSPQQGTSRALVRAEPKAKVLAHWSPFHYFGLVRDVLSPQRISQFPSLGISFFGSSKILPNISKTQANHQQHQRQSSKRKCHLRHWEQTVHLNSSLWKALSLAKVCRQWMMESGAVLARGWCLHFSLLLLCCTFQIAQRYTACLPRLQGLDTRALIYLCHRYSKESTARTFPRCCRSRPLACSCHTLRLMSVYKLWWFPGIHHKCGKSCMRQVHSHSNRFHLVHKAGIWQVFQR